MNDLRALASIIGAKLLKRPLALCDIGDADGLVSASLFLMRFPKGVVVFAPAGKVQGSRLYRMPKWDFVADLPCPGRVVIRADHHRTNRPCARHEYYDPNAPCSAYLALTALNLSNNPIAQALVKAAIETDTANIVSKEAEELDMAARFSSYGEKVKLARELSLRGFEALNEEWVKLIVERGYRARELMLKIADLIPIDNVVNVYFRDRVRGISYRQLTIELQKRGASMVNILVKLGYRTYRYYCGADVNKGFDCTKIATALGGGGHPYAAGAQYKAPILNPSHGLRRFIGALRSILNPPQLSLLEVSGGGSSINVRKITY